MSTPNSTPALPPRPLDRVLLPPTPVAYRPRTAAEVTGLSRPTIAGAIKRGELGALKLRGAIIIPRAALQRWLDERSVPCGTR